MAAAFQNDAGQANRGDESSGALEQLEDRGAVALRPDLSGYDSRFPRLRQQLPVPQRLGADSQFRRLRVEPRAGLRLSGHIERR